MLQLLDWKILAPLVGGVVFLIGFFFTKAQSKKIGRLESENLLSKKDLANLIIVAKKKEAIEKESLQDNETLNGVSWTEIKKIKEEQKLKSLSDVLAFLRSTKD